MIENGYRVTIIDEDANKPPRIPCTKLGRSHLRKALKIANGGREDETSPVKKAVDFKQLSPQQNDSTDKKKEDKYQVVDGKLVIGDKDKPNFWVTQSGTVIKPYEERKRDIKAKYLAKLERMKKSKKQ